MAHVTEEYNTEIYVAGNRHHKDWSLSCTATLSSSHLSYLNIRFPKMIIYSGFTIWSIVCGLVSLISPRTSKSSLIALMVFLGISAGQVRWNSERRGDGSFSTDLSNYDHSCPGQCASSRYGCSYRIQKCEYRACFMIGEKAHA